MPTNKLGQATINSSEFASTIDDSVKRLERLRQPIIDARKWEYEAAVAQGRTEFYAADDNKISEGAKALLLAKSEAMDVDTITEVTRTENGPVQINVRRVNDEDRSLAYLASLKRGDTGE